MAFTSERYDSPDLFSDVNMEAEETDLNAVDKNFTSVRFRNSMNFSCTGKVDDPRKLLKDFADFVRNEVKDTEANCHESISPPSMIPSRLPPGAFCYPVDLEQLSLKHEEDLETFFNVLRMSLYELESMCGTADQRSVFIRDFKNTEAESLRRQISALLTYLTEWILILCQDRTPESKELLKNTMMEIKGTLLQVGRIHQLPFFGFSLGKGGHPYFHACLDVWYAALRNFVKIQRSWRESSPCVRVADYLNNQVDDTVSYSTLEQLMDVLLSDLVVLASLKFSDELLVSDDSWCFSCPCVLKLWSLVTHYWNVTSKESTGETFWSRLHKIFRRFLIESQDNSGRAVYSDRFVVPCDLRKSIDTAGFFWRLLRGLSCLYRNADGSAPTTTPTDVRLLVEFVVSKTILPILGNTYDPPPTIEFNHTMQMETKLRYLLAQYLIVFTAFEIQTSMVLPLELWQYYYRRLGFTFCSQEISELLVVYESASEWLEKLRRLARPLVDIGCDRRNSFELFLAIVVTHCQAGDFGSRLWSAIKGRVISRMSSRRFQEFSECALFNCLRLLLITTDFFDLEMFSEYVLDFFAEIPLRGGNTGVSKQKIVWQALSVAILIHQERNAPVEFVRKIVQYLASSVTSVNQAYSRKKNDQVVRRDLWELLSYYFKLLQELSQGVKGKDDLLPVLPLWSMDFYKIFADAKECDDVRGQHRLDYLSAVAEIVKHIGKISDCEWQKIEYDERQKWAAVVKDRLIRSVRLHLHHWPWSEELADVWHYFIVVSVARADFRISTVALFNEFVNVMTPNFDTDVLCRLLVRLIEKAEILPRISQEGQLTSKEEASATIAKAWLRCLFVTTRATSSILEITRFISESAPWNDLLKEYYRNSSPNDVVPIGGNYGHCQLFKDICLALEMRCVTAPADKPKLAALCQKTFSGPVRKLNKILINADPLDVYTHCTRLLAFLVEHCAPLIHHRDANESLLREIIALTVCNVGADNTPAVVKRRRMDMATECLLHILRGLMKCDWNQNEVLKKQIFECYRVELVRLAHDRKNVIMEASPLVGALKETFTPDAGTEGTPTPIEALRRLLLTEVRTFTLTRCSNDKQIVRASLTFVRSLVERTRSALLIERESSEIVWFCMSIWILHDDRALISDCAEVIDQCHAKLEDRRTLANLLSDGFTRIAMERWQPLGWSKVLGLAAQVIKRYPAVKKNMVACVEKVTDEVKRITGSSSDLRMTAALHYFEAEIAVL